MSLQRADFSYVRGAVHGREGCSTVGIRLELNSACRIRAALQAYACSNATLFAVYLLTFSERVYDAMIVRCTGGDTEKHIEQSAFHYW